MAKVAGILGKKVGMTQLFDSKGEVHPATVLQAGPCVVTQHKSQTKDGYDSAQIGLVEFMKESKLTRPERGHLAKNNVPPVKFIPHTYENPGNYLCSLTLKTVDGRSKTIFAGVVVRRRIE